MVWPSTTTTIVSLRLPAGSPLILSHALSDNTLTFANPIAMGAVARTVRVDNGTGAVDAVLGGVVTGTSGLVKTGLGVLRLTAANTYTGGTFLNEGPVQPGVAEVAGDDGVLDVTEPAGG